MFRSVAIFIICCAMAFPVFAQDTEEASCTPEQWQQYQNVITETAASLATSDNPSLILLGLEALIDTARAVCTGAQYSKTDNPDGILGPMIFGGTLYKATLNSVGGYGSVKPLALEGNCGGFTFEMPMSTAFGGGSESTLYRFEGCVAMFEINASSAEDWTFTIERLR